MKNLIVMHGCRRGIVKDSLIGGQCQGRTILAWYSHVLCGGLHLYEEDILQACKSMEEVVLALPEDLPKMLVVH